VDGASVRAIPLWLLRAYLEELGGQVQADGSVAGEGWQARLTQLPDAEVGSLRIGQVRLELTGEAAAVARLQHALKPKLLRAGG
jgi:hypothetical protein